MKIRTVGHSAGDAFRNLWRNRLMSVASVSSVAATLVILGIVFILIVNINSMTESVKVQFDSAQVYLNDGLEQAQIQKIEKQIRSIDGVKDVVFEDRETALKKMKASWKENGSLLDGLESNPLPDSFVVVLKNLSYSKPVVSELKNLEGVEDVKYYQDIITKLLEVTRFIRTMGFSVIAVLIAVSTFIIANTIKLAVAARRREINIMKYVGATNWFIRWPFLVEGTILGLLGAFTAALIIFIVYRYTYGMFTSRFYVLIAAYIVPVQAIMGDLLIIFSVLGAGIGALGSINAMRRFLNV